MSALRALLKSQVLEIAMREEIKAAKRALKKERDEARLSVHDKSGDTGSNPEGSHKTANLNQKALISAETTGDQDQGNNFSVRIVDDDRVARDANRKLTKSVGTLKLLRMEVQEAKNRTEAVYRHLSGASFDLILMDNQMPIITRVQAKEKLRQMGVKSQIVGTTSDESDQQAFINAVVDSCIQKPLNQENIAAVVHDPNERRRINTSSQA